MHLKSGGKAACDGSEKGTEYDTHNQSKENLYRSGEAGKIKNMAEDRTGIDTLMHDNGGGGHTHTDHSADGKVGTSQQDQAGNAESKEHSRGSLLEDIQNVVVSK